MVRRAFKVSHAYIGALPSVPCGQGTDVTAVHRTATMADPSQAVTASFARGRAVGTEEEANGNILG